MRAMVLADARRLLVAVPLLLAGLVTALATALVHEIWWGLPLGLFATAATVVATPPRWWGRLAYCLGWVVAIVYASTPRTEGDYVFGRQTGDYLLVYVATPIVLVFGIVSTVLAARLRREPTTESDPTDQT